MNKPQPEAADEVVKEEVTQIGRALKELGIGWIAAHSPQAKGRIERFFGTAQDRRVKGLRLAQAPSLEAANRYLEQEYLPRWNRTFTVGAGSKADAHRPLGQEDDRAAILSHVEERVVTHDYTIRYQGKIYQLGRGDIRAGLRDGKVPAKLRDRDGVSSPAQGAPAAEAGEFEEASLEDRPRRDERVQLAEKSPAVGSPDAGNGSRSTRDGGRGGDAVGG